MKQKKRILSILLALMLMTALVVSPVTAFAEEPEDIVSDAVAADQDDGIVTVPEKEIVADPDDEAVIEEDAPVLAAASAPVITGQPSNQNVTDGEKASFTVKASGDGLTYQWWYKATDSDSFVPSGASSAATATCSLTAKARFNGYQYYCVVTDGSGNTVQSNTVTLTFN